MPQPEVYRNLVVARAGGACEYCRLLEAPTGVTFHIEHIVPISQGGKTSLANLALSCPGCNLAKAGRTNGQDRDGKVHALFNPRDYDPWFLGWHLHFYLERESGLIFPRTSIGEASVETLDMNGRHRPFARKLQVQAGLLG